MTLAIGIPIAGPPTWDLLRSLLSLEPPAGGWTLITVGSEDRPLPIPVARNAITRRALDLGAEWLLHLDADADLHPATLSRLLSHHLPIVGALSFTRRIPVVPTTYAGKDPAGRGYYTLIEEMRDWLREHPQLRTNQPAVLDPVPEDSLRAVDFTGLHCLLTHRSVYERIPEPYFSADPDTPPPATGCDRRFCEAARAAGLEVFVDRSVYAGHVCGGRNVGPVDFLAWDAVTDWQAAGRIDAPLPA